MVIIIIIFESKLSQPGMPTYMYIYESMIRKKIKKEQLWRVRVLAHTEACAFRCSS